jgi:hypothetical protein
MDEFQGQDVPETNETQETTAPENNIKAEFNRKQKELEDKVTSQLSQLAESQKALLERLEGLNQPKQTNASSEELEDLIYSDPAKYAQKIEERTAAKIREEYKAEQAKQARQNQVINDLTRKYPELNDTNSPLTQKVYEIYNQFGQDEQQNPTSIKAAVLEAASELGVLPANKRQQQNEAFSMGSSTGSRRPQTQREEELSEKTQQWASLLGLDINNKKTRESLKKRSERKVWNRYQ